MYDVLIIGAGATGTAIARMLTRYRLKVALLEKEPDVAMGATKANSAIVHGGFAEAHAKLKGRLCYQGRRQFAQLDKELHFGFKPIGSLVLAFEEEQRAGLENLLENGRKNGLDDISIIQHDQIMQLEPNVNPQVKYALYCEGAGVCSPYGLAIAQAENAIANGLDLFLNSEAQSIQKTNTEFIITTTNNSQYRTKYLVNAAGLQAGEVSAMAGVDDFTIRPRSGEYLLMTKGTGSLVNTVLFQMPTKMGKGILVTPTVYGNLMIGPDAIDEELDDRNTHAERLYHIYQEALLTTKKLDITKYLRSYAGVRPVSSTDDFIIEEAAVPGFVNVAGIQSPGMTSSPAVAELVRDLLANAGLELEENPAFNGEREAIYTPGDPLSGQDLKARIDLEEGEEGRMVCRCEQVPEAAMRTALKRGIPLTTPDAIKRRTRAAMGWCQGEFCRPRTLALMEHVTGEKPDPRTDVERLSLKRVGKEELLAYFKQKES